MSNISEGIYSHKDFNIFQYSGIIWIGLDKLTILVTIGANQL